MDSWGMIAVIVALVTIPLYTSPVIAQPILQKIRDIVARIYYRNQRCEAIRWQDLPPGPIQPYPQRRATFTLNVPEENAKSPKLAALASFLLVVWGTTTHKVSRPVYLDLAKEYLKLDAEVLLAIVLSQGGSGSPDGSPDAGTSCILHIGTAMARFRVYDNAHSFYIVGGLSETPTFEPIKVGFHDITKNDLRAIADGYPPFYRQFLHANSGVEVAHPIQSIRDITRAGWVVAIGFSIGTCPLTLYNKRQSRIYTNACERVLVTLKRLQRSYSAEPAHKSLLDMAVKVVTRMNSLTTGSGAPSMTRGTVLLNGDNSSIGRGMSASQLLFALRLFNEYTDEPLSDYERQRLDPILVEVLRAAALGIFEWWQYVNNIGRGIPGWLLDERVRGSPIWLEDGVANEL